MFRKLLALASFAPLAAANQVTLSPGCSTVLTYGVPNNWCNVSFVGEPGDILLRNHLLVRFDVAQHLPGGSVVNEARLVISVQGFTDATNFVVREVFAPACPGAAWSGSPLGLGAPAGAPLFTGGSWTTMLTSPAFTNVVRNWVAQPAQEFGLMFAVPVDATLGGRDLLRSVCVGDAPRRLRAASAVYAAVELLLSRRPSRRTLSRFPTLEPDRSVRPRAVLLRGARHVPPHFRTRAARGRTSARSS